MRPQSAGSLSHYRRRDLNVAKAPSHAKRRDRSAVPARGAARRAAVASKTAPAPSSYEDLARDLAAAKARIAELEAAHKDVLDRIAWAIDSLHTLTEESPD
jgi:hypothetical protein